MYMKLLAITVLIRSSCVPLVALGLLLSVDVALGQQTSEAMTLVYEGIAQRKAGSFTASEQTLQRALISAQLAKNPDDELSARAFLALTYLEAGQAAKALELRQENLAFARSNRQRFVLPEKEVQSLELLSHSYSALGNYSEAESLLEAALDLTEKSPGSMNPPRLLMRLGITQLLGGELARADISLVASLAAYEASFLARQVAGTVSSAGEYEFQVEVMRWLAKLRVLQGRTEEALVFAERGRSRALAALVQRNLRASSAPVTERALSLADIRAFAASRRATVVEYAVVYADYPELLLQFSDHASRPVSDLLIWVVQPDGKVAHKRVAMDPPIRLTDLIGGARDSLVRGATVVSVQGGQTGRQPTAFERLAQLLIAPIEGFLPSSPDSQVVVVPQDALFLIPFAALPTRSGKYLIEQYALSTASSIEVLRLADEMQRRLVDGASQALVVGNPTMPMVGGQRLADLPAAEHEAQAIAALLKTKALVGAAATKPAVLSRVPSARLIHLATHGMVDGGASDLSAIALAPAADDDGLLKAREIAGLSLHAELVVLSACDTALGKISGDGVAGLSRALIGAGASSVVVSLWSVPDAPTERLMLEFYQNLRGPGDKAQALRSAMLATMKEHPDPVDWAAFVLIGSNTKSGSLATALRSGMSNAQDDAPVPQARYLVFPVPPGAEQYREEPSTRVPGQMDIDFETAMSPQALLQFFRKVLGERGLREITELAGAEQIVFTETPAGKKVVVGITDLSKSGRGRRSVSIYME